jgi:DNA-binding response OmpR family regulator
LVTFFFWGPAFGRGRVCRFGVGFLAGISRPFDIGVPSPSRLPLVVMDEWPNPGRALRIMLVEDDEAISAVVTRMLRAEGLEVRSLSDGESALSEARMYKPDVVLLDLGLPGIDGVEVMRSLREQGNETAIIALTARDASESRVEGLDAGADDYVVKPFDRAELLARMRAVLRRRPPKGAAALVAGELVLDPDAMLVTIGERQVDLTDFEFRLLEYLIRNRGIVISRQQLLEEVWGWVDTSIETNNVEVFISNLRRKLEAGGEERIVLTVRGAGYVIRA